MERAYITVGVFGKIRGVAGEIRLWSATDFPEKYFRPGSFLLKRGDDLVAVRLVELRPQDGDCYIARLEGFGIDEAQGIVGCELLLPADRRVKPSRGTFYAEDMIGMAVVDAAGRALGTVSEAEPYPASACLTVRTPAGDEALVPFVKAHVANVDPKARVVTLAPGADPFTAETVA